MFKSRIYSSSDYMDALVLLSEIFYKIRKEGLVSIESDLDEPEKSAIFQKHPTFSRIITLWPFLPTPCALSP